MKFEEELRKSMTRRHFLTRCGAAVIGTVGLASLLDAELLFRASNQPRTGPFSPKPSHFAPKAKHVIFLNMTGAPSQVDLFDEKTLLAELNGQVIPPSATEGLRLGPFTNKENMRVFASPWKFKQYGQSGITLSELLPSLPEIVDDIAFIRSMHTDEINHVPAQLLLSTGSPRMGRPTMGSWVTYGLGSENSDLPGFIVLTSGKSGRCGTTCWSSGFLPSVYQGVPFRSSGDPVLYLTNPAGVDSQLRRESLNTLKALNEEALKDVGDPEIATRIESFEMAFRMQTSVPELMDISQEPPAIHEMYGTEPGKSSFSNNCLLARRLIERGVRFVQIDHGGWDHHGGGDQNLLTGLPERCQQVDRGATALIKDLKQRGLLDETLVIWGGEFGRQPMAQGPVTKQDAGRDHLRTAFTIWMAGGGVKPGIVYGATDEFGLAAVSDPVHVHDLQATILHLLGLDHTRLTYKFQGRNFRLTDVSGEIVKDILR
jgi:hypothetical protein